MVDTAAPALPMFYKAPRPLDRSKDAQLKLQRPTHFHFAQGTNAIPLLADEIPLASAYYPIVFASGPSPVPAAVVGLKNDENVFIDKNGQWDEGAYLPAYVRRYPFILMDDPEQKQFVLCIDDKCEFLNDKEGYPLFDKDQPSDFTKGAMDFCASLRQQGEETDAFVNALKEHNLLMANDAQIDAPGGAKIQLSGFLIIDPKKFDALPDSVALQWRKKGWLGLIYAQLLSSHRWQRLVHLMQARG